MLMWQLSEDKAKRKNAYVRTSMPASHGHPTPNKTGKEANTKSTCEDE